MVGGQSIDLSDEIFHRQALADRHFFRLKNPGHDHLVRQGQRSGEFFFKDISLAGVAARLEDRPQSAPAKSRSNRFDGLAHGRRMVRKVVDQQDSTPFSTNLLAALDASEIAK